MRTQIANEVRNAYLLIVQPEQSIKIDIGKPLNKSITIDINCVNVIDCID